MGYILFLTKHHDGFCLWDTKTTDRKVTKAPLGRDVLAELRKSCDKYGLKLALYFSEGEFKDRVTYHPGGYTPEMKKAQLKELLTQYGPIEYLWLDKAKGQGRMTPEETYAWCKSFQPGCFVGRNKSPEVGTDIRLGEMGRPGRLPAGSGWLLNEMTYPILHGKSDDGTNVAERWFYTRPEWENIVLPASKIYKDYLAAVESGTIFSLDVGPDRSGKLRPIDVKTLREVGAMIRANPPLLLAQSKPARASSESDQKNSNAARAFDGDIMTQWMAAAGSREGWIEVDLGRETRVTRASVMAPGDRVLKFAIEYKDGDAWIPVATGTKLPKTAVVFDFMAVSARIFRLHIIDAKDAPVVAEFKLGTLEQKAVKE
jgi:alpha-L-fucosidase